jgi:glycerol-3-phosphate cytidylyltransferase
MSRIVGYTTGVYDLFHIGHLNILKRARDCCDELVVGVTTDQLSLAVKGKLPVIPYEERFALISAIRYVDCVIPQESMDKFAAWESVRFNRMFVGDDWKGTKKWSMIEERFRLVGVDVVYFPYTQHTSSTLLRDVLGRI